MVYFLGFFVFLLMMVVGILLRQNKKLYWLYRLKKRQFHKSQVQQLQLAEQLKQLKNLEKQLSAETQSRIESEVYAELKVKFQSLELWEQKLIKQDAQLTTIAQDLETRQTLTHQIQASERLVEQLTIENDQISQQLQVLFNQLETRIDAAVAEKTAALGAQLQDLRDGPLLAVRRT